MTSIDITSAADFILETFATLGERPMPAGAVDARRIPGRNDSLAGVSADREFFLLLEVDDQTLLPERRLNALRVIVGDSFTVLDSLTGSRLEQRFAAVILRSGHDELASSFALVAATLLSTLSTPPTAGEVVGFVDSLMRLVATPRSVSYETVLGLWGELWLMTTVQDPLAYASAWHSGVSDRFDFSFPQARLEVKTTLSAARRHEFSLEQLESSDAKPLWIASVQAVIDVSGRTVVGLCQELVGLLPPAAASRVLRIAVETLSGDIESAQDFSFEPVGPQPLMLFDAVDIPRVRVPERSGISGVRFQVDLDQVAPAGRSVDELGV